jgi:hypothetical protein
VRLLEHLIVVVFVILRKSSTRKSQEFLFFLNFKFLRPGNFNYVYFNFRGGVEDCRW